MVKRGQTEVARSVGVMASAALAEKRRRESLAIAEPLWLLPSEEISIVQITKKTKLSVRTLQKMARAEGRLSGRNFEREAAAMSENVEPKATEARLREVLGRLRAAFGVVMDEIDADPTATTIDFNAVGPEAARVFAPVRLSDLFAEADALLGIKS